MGELRVHNSRNVEDFVRNHQDEPLTVEKVSAAVSWGMASTSKVLATMCKNYPENMERVRRGVYRWNSSKRPLQAVKEPETFESPTELILSVVSTNGDKLLVRDEESGALYVMQPFKF